jgi:hypothetical protein
MEKGAFQEHVDNCPKKPRICQYCGLQFKRDLYDEHIQMCSTRTEKCEKCKKNIQKRGKLIQRSKCDFESCSLPKTIDLEYHMIECAQTSYHDNFPSLNQPGDAALGFNNSIRVSKPEQVPPARRDMFEPQASQYSDYDRIAKPQITTSTRPQANIGANVSSRPSAFDRSQIQSNTSGLGARNASYTSQTSQISRNNNQPLPSRNQSQIGASAGGRNNLGVSLAESINRPNDG